MTAALHLVQLRLDRAGVARLAGRAALRSGPPDLGYIVHCLLVELFGALAPKPFALQSEPKRFDGDGIEVLGYGAADEGALRAHADTFALPDTRKLLVEPVRTKQMPTLGAGLRLGFRVRVCPTIRRKRPWPGREDGVGAEQDAWLHAIDAVPGVPVSPAERRTDLPQRDDVYQGWLAAAMREEDGNTGRIGHVASAAAIHHLRARLVEHRRERLLRRGNGDETQRRARTVELPAATFEGAFTVADESAFRALLARGVGRHRAFGFGMLLLHPPGAG